MLDIDETIENEISRAVSFIQKALDQEPSYIEMDSGEEETEPLLLDKNLSELSFHIIKEEEPQGRVAAVDGGSATVVKGRSFLIGVHRVGSITYRQGQRTDQKMMPLKLELISRANLSSIYSSAYMDLVGEEPSEAPAMDRMLDRLRLFCEWKLAGQLLDELESGDMLLIDGSLKASIAPPYTFWLEFTRKAKAKGVHLVGVTKTSTLYWGDKSPLIPAVMKTGERFFPNSKWFCQISDEKLHTTSSSYFGKIYVARLKASSDFAFRIDVNRIDPADPGMIFSALSHLSGDPAFLGYPYPLAAAHTVSRVALSEIEDIRYKLQSRAFESGVTLSDWNLLFTDFHEVLNADLNR
ncbi:MAG: DNA double-strand break repair nuclease NurA [Candidatus Zixiibacteriota bacterium]|nr:MAG: DNA double-strand break repair nuclease NurA [candidate division Zixibacteria bacterium]